MPKKKASSAQPSGPSSTTDKHPRPTPSLTSTPTSPSPVPTSPPPLCPRFSQFVREIAQEVPQPRRWHRLRAVEDHPGRRHRTSPKSHQLHPSPRAFPRRQRSPGRNPRLRLRLHSLLPAPRHPFHRHRLRRPLRRLPLRLRQLQLVRPLRRPHLRLEQQQARVFGLEILHMADADVLPYDYQLYASRSPRYIDRRPATRHYRQTHPRLHPRPRRVPALHRRRHRHPCAPVRPSRQTPPPSTCALAAAEAAFSSPTASPTPLVQAHHLRPRRVHRLRRRRHPRRQRGHRTASDAPRAQTQLAALAARPQPRRRYPRIRRRISPLSKERISITTPRNELLYNFRASLIPDPTTVLYVPPPGTRRIIASKEGSTPPQGAIQ